MRKRQLTALLLAGIMVFGLAACGAQTEKEKESATQTEAVGSETEESTNQTEENPDTENQNATEEDVEYEGDATSYYIEVYKTVLDQHKQAISEKWDEQKLLEEGLSPLLSYCYEGDALQNIGYAFLDIDGDGAYELFIEPISGDEFVDQMIFEMYTCKNDEIKQVLCGDVRDKYYLGDLEEGGYIVSNYASSGAAQSTWNYFTLEGDQLTLVQGILFDETEDTENPWSFAYEEERLANEDSARELIQSYEQRRIQPEAIAFSLYP